MHVVGGTTLSFASEALLTNQLKAVGVFLSGEWMLTWLGLANSGGVVLARSVWCTGWLYSIALLLFEASRAHTAWGTLSGEAARAAVHATLPWAGAMLGGVYAALYSRFSSQWLYLANLYNEIKRAEIDVALSQDPSKAEIPLHEWQAAFIADAMTLHLANKDLYSAAIRAWLEEAAVLRELVVNPTDAKECRNLVRLAKQVGVKHADAIVDRWQAAQPAESAAATEGAPAGAPH